MRNGDNKNFINAREIVEHNIDLLDSKALDLLCEVILPKYTTKENITKFKKGNVQLLDIGICTGITLCIDFELQTLHPDLCILTEDTLGKFISDISRDFKYIGL